MRFLYNFILQLITLLLSPFFLIGLLFSGKLRLHLGQRLGFHSRKMRKQFQEMPRPRVWLHAASVGELSAITPIVQALKERNPDMAIVVSTNTATGYALAMQKMTFASACIIMPLDYPGVVKRVFKMVEPNLLVIAETELWPNVIRLAKKNGCQMALINGRLSEKSFQRYRKIRSMVKQMLAGFDLIAVQSKADGERFKALGANPQRLKMIGNVKFDVSSGSGIPKLKEDLRLAPGRPVWVAGSTRPGEEEMVLEAFAKVQEKVPNAVLILALRHLERLRDIERLLTQKRIAFTHRSRVGKELIDFPVILLDTMGELAETYGLGTVAFVGGSLQPFGGHNPLEPAGLGVPVLIGPHTEHFAQVTQMLLQSGGAKVVTTSEELAQAVSTLLLAPEQAGHMGEQAKKVVAACQGTANETVELLQKLMLIKRWAGEVRKWRQESLQNQGYTTPKEILSNDWTEW
ncbi:3-deoxy-D-manno-octulosonic acid transferase [bacterium]|nr:3-deoxy-D-manno-octulosonic acid transferase [bacterium]